MKKLLLLTDFSEASRHALDYARRFFGDTVADFHLLCVYTSASGTLYNPIYSHEASHTDYTDLLNDIMAQLRREATSDWHTYRSTACAGNWLDVIERSLRLEVYDFVVIGAQKDGTASLFGVSAVALTRQLKTNVLVVPADAPAEDIRRVVLATDFTRLKNAKLLSPLKDLVTLKGADLTLLTIDVPDKNIIEAEQELHIRQFLMPIEPIASRLKANTASEGIDRYLDENQVSLLVMIPALKDDISALSWESQPYTPFVPVLTLYDDGTSDQPHTENLENAPYAHE